MTVPQENVSTVKQEDMLEQTLHDGVYKVQHVLTRGRWSTIYLVSHVALSVPLAIKQFHTSLELPESVRVELDTLLRDGPRDNFVPDTPIFSHTAITFPRRNETSNECFAELVREVLFLARVQHPTLPMLYDYFFENDSWYLVMDYIPGMTLDTYLKSKRPLPPLEALDYALQLCRVLEYLHTQVPAIIFHALEPSHVLLLPDHTIALVDFGHAHYAKERTGRVISPVSKRDYAVSPQIDVQEFYDPRLDLYDLGMLLYAMLSEHVERGEQTEKELKEALPPLHVVNPNVSHVLSGIVKLATCSDPLQRFQSAHTFFLALERAFAIEERRLLQQQVSHSEQDTSKREDAIDWPEMEESFSLHLEHRRQLRTRFWQSHSAQSQHKQIAQQMFSTDENSRDRSSSPLEQPTSLLLEQPRMQVRTEDARIVRPMNDGAPPGLPRIRTLSHRTVQNIVQTCFVIALILFLVLVSLLLYMRSKRPDSPNIPESMPNIPHNTSHVSAMISHSSWQVLPSLPSPEADNAAVYVIVAGRPYLYMNGGYRKSADDASQYDTDYDHSLYRYDIEAAHWEVVTDHFPGLVNNAATVDEHGTIFFTTGYSSDSYSVTSVLWQFQPVNGVTLRIQPPAQIMPGFGSAMIADQQGHLFLSQGFLSAGDPHALAGTGWYRYDIATGQWHTLASMPVGLGYVTLARDSRGDGSILLLGGSTDAGQQMQSDKIYRYDSIHDSWLQEAITLPHPISGEASCLPYPDTLALVGGVDAGQQVGTANALILDLRTLHSTPLPAFPGGGSALGVAACDNAGHLFFARGTADLKLSTRDFWLLMVQGQPGLTRSENAH